MEFNLPKDEILKGKKSFEKAFKFGTLISGFYVSIVLLKAETRKVGFAVTKNIKRAVVRNRYKRILREIYRLNKTKFPEKAHIILVAKGRSDNLLALQSDVLKILTQD